MKISIDLISLLTSFVEYILKISFPSRSTDILVGLLRLRKCSEASFRPELKGGCSIVRELHVYLFYET